jgi:hypothetical protein
MCISSETQEEIQTKYRRSTEARAKVGGPQVKYICIRGLKIPPQL